MNWIFIGFAILGFGTAAFQQLMSSSPEMMHSLTHAMLQSANDAVSIIIGLVGVLALFLGLMKVLDDAGFIQTLSKAFYPILRLIFPEIPPQHPAMGAMTLNLSANLLGMGNAATPFGIKAMQALNTLNTHPGTATHAMILFLAINTSSLTLLPTKVIALRVEAQSHDPTGIIATTLFATLCSTLVAIVSAKFLAKLSDKRHPTLAATQHFAPKKSQQLLAWVLMAVIVSLIPICLIWGKHFTPWIIPILFPIVLIYGALKKVDVYQSFVEGAKEGFEVAIKILPYLVAILVVISMLRASGALLAFSTWVGQYTAPLGLPADAIPMALMRPLSGSGSFGVMTEIFQNPDFGPDSYVGYLVSTMMGSTETTFYVLAVYFGAIQIKRFRYAITAALLADLTGIVASVFAVKTFLG